MEILQGTVERITFQSPDGGFLVFRLRPQNEKSAVTVTGGFTAPLVGEVVEVSGEWGEHPRFGRQFKAVALHRAAPTTLQGIERFLASGVIKGVGAAMAARLVRQFGADVLDVIQQQPKRLREVEGIGAKKAEQIHQSYAEQGEMREIMLFLESHGVTGTHAAKLYQRYGSFAVRVLQDDPYRLAAEVSGIGFRTADQIAMNIGLERNHSGRVQAGIEHALLQTAQAGHCCLPEEALVEEAAKLLGVETGDVAEVLKQMLGVQRLNVEDAHGTMLVYPRFLYLAERYVAERLLELRDQARPVRGEEAEERVARWQQGAGIELAAAQREALLSAVRHGVLAITGGPGTGKTTIVQGVLSILEPAGFRVQLAAPTGRAAKRLSEATGREASTVHRLLEATGGMTEEAAMFLRDEDNPLEADVIIVDEVSMMDIILMYNLLKALPAGCRLVLVGDVDQLPAVGPGSVLKDILRSQSVPVTRLTEVYRQAGKSLIVTNAHRINRGLMPEFTGPAEFDFREVPGDETAATEIVRLCREELGREGYDLLRDVQVLSPMHRMPCGVENLNRQLQQALNPAVFGVDTGGRLLPRERDKVMQMKNNYTKGVFNGDVGVVLKRTEQQIIVRYPEHDIVYESGEWDELHLAYAMTVHKSQGSEYPVVILPLLPSHHMMLQRNLLYTAVTRAKRRVILVGTKSALHTAVANDRTRRRYTLLAERLRGVERG